MYDIILNALTADAIKRFLKASGNTEIKLSQSKEDLIKDINQAISDDDDFHKAFKSFYRKLEKGGRKDFWLAELRYKLPASQLQSIRSRISKIPKESDKIYIPVKEGDMAFFDVSTTNDAIEIKIIRKKIIRKQDATKNSSDSNYEYVAYKKTPIRHVTFIKFDLNKEQLLIGVDVWQILSTKDKLKQVEADLDSVFGEGFWTIVKLRDIKVQSKKLLSDFENILTKKLEGQVSSNIHQGAIFNIDTGRVTNIRKELNAGTIQLAEIKDRYIEDDVRDNAVLKVASSQNIDITTKGGSGVLFYYPDLTEQYEYFKFDVFVEDSRIKFANDNTTLDDLNHVFSKIN